MHSSGNLCTSIVRPPYVRAQVTVRWHHLASKAILWLCGQTEFRHIHHLSLQPVHWSLLDLWPLLPCVSFRGLFMENPTEMHLLIKYSCGGRSDQLFYWLNLPSPFHVWTWIVGQTWICPFSNEGIKVKKNLQEWTRLPGDSSPSTELLEFTELLGFKHKKKFAKCNSTRSPHNMFLCHSIVMRWLPRAQHWGTQSLISHSCKKSVIAINQCVFILCESHARS
jgi:hypothetical protein